MTGLEEGEQSMLFAPKISFPKRHKLRLKTGHIFHLHYNLVQDEESFAAMFKKLRECAAERIAWDTETSGLKPSLGARIVGHALLCRESDLLHGFYIPIRHRGEENRHERQLPLDLVNNELRAYFSDPNGGTVVTFNGKFDRKQALADDIRINRPVVDVALSAQAENENERSFALKNLTAQNLLGSAKNEQHSVNEWMKADAKRLGMSFKKHSPQKKQRLVAQHGLNGLLEPTYMERFGHARVPLRLEGRYGIRDVAYTWLNDRITYAQTSTKFREVWEREHRITDVLLEAEFNGLPASADTIRKTHVDLKREVEYWLKQCKTMYPSLPADFTAGDSEIRSLFYDRDGLNLSVLRETDSGAPSVDKVARKLLAKSYPEHALLIEALDKLSTSIKLLGTYAGSFLKHYSPTTGCIHGVYNQMERREKGGPPVTGRVSAADPNVQNIAKRPLHLFDCACDACIEFDEKAGRTHHVTWRQGLRAARIAKGESPKRTVSIKRYFYVPKGLVRAYIDFSQVELRVLAWFCQDPTMLRAFKEGKDLHQSMADQLGIPRDIAKQVNFGINYGLTEVGLALRIPGYYDDPEGTVVFAKQVLAQYLAAFPRISVFRREFGRSVRRAGGFFQNPFGRPRRILQLLSDQQHERNAAERKMMSSIISGTSADIMKEAMLRVVPGIRAAGGLFRQQIHDEVVFDLPYRAGWVQQMIDAKRRMEDWPMFSEDTAERMGVPIKCSLEIALPGQTWEDKREADVHADGSISWAA